MLRRSFLACSLVVACTPEAKVGIATALGGDGSETGAGTTTGDVGESTSSTSTGGDTTTAADDGAVFDVGTPDFPAYDDCNKIDFVFIVDGSVSMADDQANLVANFPAFIDGIKTSLSAVNDYHLGVIPAVKWFPQNPAGCDWDAGLVVNSDQAACGPYAEGGNYMTAADDLSSSFACAAATATGDIELPIWALQQTVDQSLQDPGECNEGFLRDDSLLVVVIITDEADGPDDPEAAVCANDPDEYDCPSTTPGTPAEWFDAIVSARGGIEQNIVVLSLVQYVDGPCPPFGPNPDQFDGKNIVELTQMFTHGIVAGLCEESYAPYFQQAVDVVTDACADFQPPG